MVKCADSGPVLTARNRSRRALGLRMRRHRATASSSESHPLPKNSFVLWASNNPENDVKDPDGVQIALQIDRCNCSFISLIKCFPNMNELSVLRCVVERENPPLQLAKDP